MGDSLHVFGASGAIGGAVAREGVRRDRLVTGYARTAPDIEGIRGVALDLSDAEAVRALCGAGEPVHTVVFAQGYQPSSNLQETTADHVRTMLDVHVTGVLLALQALQPRLTQGSSVVLVSSIAATKGSYDPAYAAAKGAVASLVRSLAKELFGTARVNAVAPGLIEGSPVHRSMEPEHAARHSQRMFGNRLVSADSVASSIWHLVDNPALNGAVLAVDGGYV